MDTQPNNEAIKLCDTVLEYVPEFKDYEYFSMWGKENPYLHFGNFGSFLVERLKKFGDLDDITKRSFDFVNESYNSASSDYVCTMLGTEVFERLTASEETINTAYVYLKGEALEGFHAASVGTLMHKERGGGQLGLGYPWSWLWATYPFAKIEVYDGRIVFGIAWHETEVLPRDIKSVSRWLVIPYVIDGIKVNYQTLNESSYFIFWSFRGAGRIKEMIERLINRYSK
jgi:hypothetical protein